MIQACHRALLFLLFKDVETSQCIDLYPDAFGSVRGVFLNLLTASMAKMTIAGASGGFGILFLTIEIAEIIHRLSIVLECRAEAPAPQKVVHTQIKAPSGAPTEVL